VFAAEGARLCLDALKSEISVTRVFVTEKALSKWPELNKLVEAAAEAFTVTEQVAEKLADAKTPQGVFALLKTPERQRPREHAGQAYLLLNTLQDPGNLGTIIRTAEALGISGAALSACPDIYSPKVLRAAMGGVFRFNTWQAPDMAGELAALKAGGVRTYAAALAPGAVSLKNADFARPCAVLLGNEGAGLPAELIAACDGFVKIPMAGNSPADSLCVSAAAGIFAWEMTKCQI
jgi:TrmH family RNA methyltransferase